LPSSAQVDYLAPFKFRELFATSVTFLLPSSSLRHVSSAAI
jgi:hypothetical protein